MTDNPLDTPCAAEWRKGHHEVYIERRHGVGDLVTWCRACGVVGESVGTAERVNEAVQNLKRHSTGGTRG